MKTIVNVNEKWGIGKDGDLLVHIPADMAFFRETTRGAVVIMGSTTLDSFPCMAPLKNRVNIVLVDDDKKIHQESIDAAEEHKSLGLSTKLIYVHSLDEAVELGRKYESEGRDVFVIGGATIYRIMLPYCDTAYVTINNCEREADTYFPDLAEAGWKMTSEGPEQIWDGTTFRFTTWEKN